MSTGWAIWVMALIVFNTSVTLFLFIWAQRVHIPMLTDGTTGHVWAHGAIREGLRRLPMWWVLLSAAMYVGAIGYQVLYANYGPVQGILGWTSHQQLADAQAHNRELLARTVDRFALYPVEKLASDKAALHIGKRVFEDNCAACHRLDASGNVPIGAPSLADGAWLYGGDGEAIVASIENGRAGVMPPWDSLGEQNVKNLTQYVLSLSGREHDAAAAAAAKPLFGTCAACHGADGKGNHALGAPDLTDGTWLHGSSVADIEHTIGEGRNGHMPAWKDRLQPYQVRSVAAWVYHLSHGDGRSQ